MLWEGKIDAMERERETERQRDRVGGGVPADYHREGGLASEKNKPARAGVVGGANLRVGEAHQFEAVFGKEDEDPEGDFHPRNAPALCPVVVRAPFFFYK